MAISQNVEAYDFSAVAPSGQTLYYNIVNGQAEVTYKIFPSSGNPSYQNPLLSGDLIIPSTVSNNGNTYTVVSIGGWAFKKCHSLTSVIIPNTVTTINAEAFMQCGISSITLPNSLIDIGREAFFQCTGLTSVTIPNNVEIIDYHAFWGCSSLSSVVFNADSCYLDNVFYNTTITSFIFGDGVRHIPAYICDYMTGLTTITIPSTVSSIGNYAFCRCSGLISVTLPTSLIRIGDGAFSGCTSLVSIDIPYSVQTIGSEAFANCESLSSITIPNSVEYIGDCSFENCNSLTHIAFNADSCIYAGGSKQTSAFGNCSILANITLGNNVKRIPSYAFCPNTDVLTTVTIPHSVKMIGRNSFSYCRGMSVVYNAENCISDSMSVDSYDAPFMYCNITNFIFGNDVRCIPDYLCANMENLTAVSIPNSVMSIGKGAFCGCSGLTNIIIPNTITVIDDGTFSGCSGLESVTIPNTVTRIGRRAFSGCTGLSSIDIPNSVITIEDGAFDHCTGLSTITIPNSVISIGYQAFYGCSNIVSVSIPASVTNIGYEAFRYCTGLTSISIPDGINNIEQFTFSGCTAMTSVTIGRSVTNIEKYAFSDCSGLTEIHSRARVAPTLGDNVFRNVSSDIPVYIPQDNVISSYYTRWSYFWNFIEEDVSIADISADNVKIYFREGHIVVDGVQNEQIQIFDTMGRETANEHLPKGVYLVKIGNHPARKVVVIR